MTFGYVQKRFDQKDKVNFKISDFITWKQTIAIHTLSNISRSKGNHTVKSGQLIEHDIRNIFPEKSYMKRSGETIPKPFPK